MKASEIASLSDVELVHKTVELERQMMANLLRHRLGRLENSSLLKKARRNVARLKTVLRSRELAAGLPQGSLESKHVASYQPKAADSQTAGPGFLQSILDKKE